MIGRVARTMNEMDELEAEDTFTAIHGGSPLADT